MTNYPLPITHYLLPIDIMYSSNLVLRRYTPPTCTLEILANGSPLSRWFDRPLLKQVKFQLNFDDPRMPEEKRATITGNKTQLDLLCQVVQAYVQEFLDRSAEELDESSLSLELGDRSELSEPNAQPLHDFADIPTATLERPPFQPAEVESPEGDNSTDTADLRSHTTESSENSPAVLSTPSTEIYLQPQGLLSHNLYLGSLANHDSGPFVHLSLLQLFDLATALDEYASDVEVLPNLPRPVRNPLTIWTGIAAMLLVTVGVTTVVVKVADRKTFRRDPVASTANSEVKPNEQQPIAVAPSPQASVGVPAPPTTLPQTLPSLPPSAASITPTPGATPPVVSGASPSPGATPPVVSGASPSPGAKSPVASGASPSPGITPPVVSGASPSPGAKSPVASGASPSPATSSTPSPADTYKLPLHSAAPLANNSNQSTPQNSRDRRSVVQIIPPQTTPPQQIRQQPRPKQPPVVAPPPLTTPPSMDVPSPLISPPPSHQNVPPPLETQVASQPSPRRQTRPIAKPNPSPRVVATRSASPTPFSPTPLASANIPAPISKPQEIAQTPANHAGETFSETSPGPSNSISAQTPVATRSGVTATPPSPITSPPAERNNNTLFDTIPQVAEARNYFQNRWQPPSNLSQPLEYSLRLNSDGTIRQILPLGQVAEVYLDRTEMPLLGEPFVSPVEGKRNPRIRVILSPDGKVQTHLESLD